MFKLGILMLLKKFKQKNIKIDNIDIMAKEKGNKFFINFWYGSKIVYATETMTFQETKAYLKGMIKACEL